MKREKVTPTEGMVLVPNGHGEKICEARIDHMAHLWTPEGKKWPQRYCPGRGHVIDGVSEQERQRDQGKRPESH